MKKKLIRITTIPLSLDKLLEGQLKFMSEFYDIIAISSDKVQLEKIANREGVDFFEVELTRKISLLKDIKAVIKLYNLLKKEKPFIVHTHTPKAGLIGMLASWLARVPHRLHTVAGLPLMEATGIKRQILNTTEKITYACATKIYPNSYGLKQFIVDKQFTKLDKLRVIANGSSNGINTDYFNPAIYFKEERTKLRQDLGINKNDFVFIFVGRMVGDKGINELVEAFDFISKENDHAKLLLVGPLEAHLDPLKDITLNILEKNKSIISVGYQNDVRPYFNSADVLVFPSYREGFPNVVMQAGAMEIPSIVSDINGCNEIIKNDTNGSIIPVKNVEKLTDVMFQYLNKSKDEIAKMGKRARLEIVENYDRNRIWEALLDEYKNLEKNV